jgi:pyruvate/2-oxoglutarate dehydrogenase complex dihydrolipoamide acyltransferase (E2) component
MPFPLHTPRVNNNDDFVRLVRLWVDPGAFVNAGAAVADIETEKATVTVETEKDGYVLQVCGSKGDMVKVGDVLIWMGASADEKPPPMMNAVASPGDVSSDAVIRQGASKAPTLRAAMLIAEYGLDALEIQASGERLTSEEVQRFITSRPAAAAHSAARRSEPVDDDIPLVPGKWTDLDPQRRGMLRAVCWQRLHAVPGYVETTYNVERWADRAIAYQKQRKMMLSPLLALMAWRLVQIVKEKPRINSTLMHGRHYAYDAVNLGFTMQTGDDLHVVVVRSAETMDETSFVTRLGELQRAAMKRALKPEETLGATVGFSSMARWPTTRHIPVLLPHTAFMVAHCATLYREAALGATYDHRVLTGADAIVVLRQICETH